MTRQALKKMEKEPSETLREVVLSLRRIAIADPRVLPIAEKIERIAESQAEYEAAQRKPSGK